MTNATHEDRKILILEEEIDKRIVSLCKEVVENCDGVELVLIGVLEGASTLTDEIYEILTDLGVNCEIDYMKVSSYGDEEESSEEVKIEYDPKVDIAGKNVLIVEDIVDTGLSMKKVLELLASYSPTLVEILSLLSKPDRRKHDVVIKYLGFEIDNVFVWGRGLDLYGKLRKLRDIYYKPNGSDARYRIPESKLVA